MRISALFYPNCREDDDPGLRNGGPAWLRYPRRSLENCAEIRGLEARTADKPAADVRNCEDFCGIGGLHGTAVENACVFAVLAKAFDQTGADVRMNLGDLRIRWRASGSNGPNRFIGDRGIGRCKPVRNAFVDLTAADR